MTIESSLGGGETGVNRIGIEAFPNSAEGKDHLLQFSSVKFVKASVSLNSYI